MVLPKYIGYTHDEDDKHWEIIRLANAGNGDGQLPRYQLYGGSLRSSGPVVDGMSPAVPDVLKAGETVHLLADIP
jgi:hypothetical protein